MSRVLFSRAFRSAAARSALGVSVLGVAAYSLDAERIAHAKSTITGLHNYLANRYTVHLDAAAAPIPVTPPQGTFGLDPATSVQHPLTLTPASAPELALVGVGVRTVSFLSFKVYSAAFYANDYSLKKLRSIKGWENYNPEEFAANKGEELVQNLMDVPTAVAIRIVPVRNTDFGHLRDGFTRTLLARAKEQRKVGNSLQDDERIDTAIQLLKSVFPAGSVPKGSPLTLVHYNDNLYIEYQGRVLGSVHDKWVADNLMRAYFSADPISPPLRGDAARGFQKYYNE